MQGHIVQRVVQNKPCSVLDKPCSQIHTSKEFVNEFCSLSLASHKKTHLVLAAPDQYSISNMDLRLKDMLQSPVG